MGISTSTDRTSARDTLVTLRAEFTFRFLRLTGLLTQPSGAILAGAAITVLRALMGICASADRASTRHALIALGA